jgi:ATP-dependent exoDNAse (exonuclease V) beta subunit
MSNAAPHFELAETPIEDGTTLIEASAGTGKTYCLAGLVVRLLVERKVDSIGRILVVTFTNAAADELSGRIREAVRHAREMLSRPAEGPGEEPYLRALRERFGTAAATRCSPSTTCRSPPSTASASRCSKATPSKADCLSTPS